MNLWEQYNPERGLGEVLGEIAGLPLGQCSDKALFECLKRHLTRRELRCFVMAQGGMPKEAIFEETGLTPEAMEKTLQKAGKKLRQPKLQQEFRTLLCSLEGEENDEAY
jgi:hypothetical protein